MAQEQCERFRESISLGLDGMLSAFEAALLDRHLRRCEGCRAFAGDATAQTQLLRAAALEEPSRPVTIVAAQRPFRRYATGVAATLAVAALAALLTLMPTAGQRTEARSAAGTGETLLAVFPGQSSPGATFDVPRLRVVSAASADGPVHGDYGLPVLLKGSRIAG